MHTHSNHITLHKNILYTALFLLLMLAAFFLIRTLFPTGYSARKKADLNQISSEEYESIFCSMYSIENYSSDDFATYRGLNTLKLQNSLKNTSDVGKYLEAAFSSNNTITNIYLGLDPLQIWKSSNKNTEKYYNNIYNDILSYISAHPEVTFEVLLPYPSMEYWLQQSAEQTELTLTVYDSLIRDFEPYANVTTYFLGAEHWLITNPANYEDRMTANELISQKLMLYTFCDHKYRITSENAPSQLDTLKTMITQERTTPAEYSDLSDWDVVFFGDSIIGNYVNTSSIPGVVAGLSGAETYNCGKGGVPASQSPDSPFSFPDSVEHFLSQNASQIPEEDPFRSSLENYLQDDHSGKKLCFVINFGLNDYFSGYPVANLSDPYDSATYAGALRTGIQRLQQNYPDAVILLMAPTYTTFFSNGNEIRDEKGGILTDYVDAALQVADEMTIPFMNNYLDMGINEDNAWVYLDDGCHLNETGRYLLATQIIERLGGL